MTKSNIPGPKARAMIERDKKVISPSYPRGYPFVMDHGKGSEVWDVDGNRFLDFMGGVESGEAGGATDGAAGAAMGAGLRRTVSVPAASSATSVRAVPATRRSSASRGGKLPRSGSV